MAPTKKIMKRVPASPRSDSGPEPDTEWSPPSPNGATDAALRGGWGASQEVIDSTSSYAQTFRPETKTQIIKILEERPYVAFRRHWVERVGLGRRAYTCLQSQGRDCPLCGVGDKASAVTSFNIAVCSDDGVATLKSWDCGVKVTRQLKTYANDPKIGPLNRDGLYFQVMKTEAQQRQQQTTVVNPVRGRDLLEDWSVPPLDAAQIAKLLEKCYTPDIIEIPNPAELEEVALEITGDVPSTTSQRAWGDES